MLVFGEPLGLYRVRGWAWLCWLAFPLCVVAALAPGSGLARLRRLGLLCRCLPRLSDRWVNESLVLSPWVPMLAQALAIQFLAQALELDTGVSPRKLRGFIIDIYHFLNSAT